MDVYAFIRQRTGKTESELSTGAIETEYVGQVVTLEARFPCVAPYTGLSFRERILFERAAALLTAAALSGGTGAVKQIEQGPVTIEYATVSKPVDFSEEARETLSLIACIGQEAFNDYRGALSIAQPVSALPNANDPRDSYYQGDRQRVADAGL